MRKRNASLNPNTSIRPNFQKWALSKNQEERNQSASSRPKLLSRLENSDLTLNFSQSHRAYPWHIDYLTQTKIRSCYYQTRIHLIVNHFMHVRPQTNDDKKNAVMRWGTNTGATQKKIWPQHSADPRVSQKSSSEAAKWIAVLRFSAHSKFEVSQCGEIRCGEVRLSWWGWNHPFHTDKICVHSWF